MANWTKETLEAALEDKGWPIVSTANIQNAFRFTLKEGVNINLFNTGTCTVDGGSENDFKSKVKAFVQAGPNGAASESGKSSSDQRVFVVYGHDATALDQLKSMLQTFKVEPVILPDIPGVGDTIIEKLERLTNADFACVLLTPDDVGAENCEPINLRPRARQNVVLELGMVLSRLGRRKVAILVNEDVDDFEKPSDIDGLIYIPYKESVKEVATELAAAMENVGFRKISATELASV